ncbi:MAG: 50S ribosomal protein L10 [Oligoflexia bacterium]|nr:50S ribosomal protein L10 [Oligoflexia bacterium]
MIRRSDKEETIDLLKKNFNASKAVFLTNVIGITSNDSVKVRKEIRAAKGKIIVARNTLFKKAAEGSGYEKLVSDLKGPHAVVFAYEDASLVAKVLHQASKDFEPVKLMGGFLNDKELSAKDVETLAKLPSRDQMLGTLLATFNAPISAFARVIEEIRKKKEEGAI